MTQTKLGGLKAQVTIMKKYGVTKDGKSKLHVESGRKGGTKNPHTSGGFRDKELAKRAGKLGGTASRRLK